MTEPLTPEERLATAQRELKRLTEQREAEMERVIRWLQRVVWGARFLILLVIVAVIFGSEVWGHTELEAIHEPHVEGNRVALTGEVKLNPANAIADLLA
jgi:hypothetical protein